MCAILDSDVVRQVFGTDQPPAAQVSGADRPPAGKAFFNWINSGRGRLVVGGQLRRELDKNNKFREWLKQAVLSGRANKYNDDEVEDKTEELKNAGLCRSDDPHTVALAQISGARLLFTNDEDLKKDFTDKKLIDNPPGKVYTLHRKKRGGKGEVRMEDFQKGHKLLLGNRSLCKRQ